MLLAAACVPGLAESPQALVAKGNRAYKDQRYPEALKEYEEAAKTKPDSPQVWFNKGNALYMQGDFPHALDAYENAAIHSDNAPLEARSKFNQGNAALRQGMAEAQANPDQAIDSIGKGVHYYQDALKLDPRLNDAKHNIEVARRFMQQIREQMKKQPPPPKQGDRKKDDKQPQQQQQSEQQKQQQQQQQKQSRDRQDARKQEARSARDILDKERENRQRRQLQTAGGSRPVDKDW